ncbi:hypothetical protein DL89DRAFT_271706 [Linderina pennispora]|uniref:Vacuolar protein sorting-associated protein 16 homolog n=1 Tax=Linderina pennispora TaxID=61395 RepID=A0A1Y1VUE8_9FUNG|nr:uncharacterized protein DL89DRAFT_271706 [Linderina pennispora]ORX64918.1 hypothetical protein DL89DRAFT_271706 [Linderina pennispora]
MCFRASGLLIGKIEYDGLHIAAFSWNSREELVCVHEDGSVRVFGLSAPGSAFSLGNEAKEAGVGFVARTADGKLIYPKMLGKHTGEVSSWTIIPPHLSLSHHTILQIDAVGTQDQLLDSGPFSSISVSPNGRLVVLCSESGRVQVSFSDMEHGAAERPADIAWCGSDAVAVLLGPFGDSLVFPTDEPMCLVQELDGAHEFLFKVSDESKAVFQIGLQTPASMLYDSLENIKAHSSQAGSTIRDLGDDLPYAIDTCIAAASCEPIVEIQQALLRTASFGKAFLDVYNGDKLVDICKHLRIVNCLAQYENGIPVSTMQFLSQPFEDWIARLLNRNQHQLAILMCRYMEEPADQIRASTIDDDALYKIIMSKLQSVPGISYVDIAEKLAIRLLKHEPRAGNQESTAMDEAIRSGDADLVYFAMELVDFFKVISHSRKYCIDQKSPEDARRKSAQLILIDNLDKHDVGELVANLKKDKTSARQTKAMDAHIKLPEGPMQGEKFVGLTVNETVAKCMARGNYTRANKLKGDFKVPERRFYWIKVHALVQRRDWAELARLANARKPPIGYRAFVDECIGALQYQEAARYIAKCDQGERAELFLRIGYYHEAAQVAVAGKDVGLLRRIQAQTQDASLQHDIGVQIEQLGGGI